MLVGIVSVVRDIILHTYKIWIKTNCEIDIKLGEVACPLPPLVCGEAGLCQGTLVHGEGAASIGNCEDNCANFDGCNYYTFDPTLTQCYMFETCPSVDDTLCQECVSGSPGCDSMWNNLCFLNELTNIHIMCMFNWPYYNACLKRSDQQFMIRGRLSQCQVSTPL